MNDIRKPLSTQDLQNMNQMFQNGTPFHIIAQSFNLNPNSKEAYWKKISRSRNLPLSEKILDLLHKNMTTKEISQSLNCSKSLVHTVKTKSKTQPQYTNQQLALLILEETIKLTETLTQNKP